MPLLNLAKLISKEGKQAQFKEIKFSKIYKYTYYYNELA